MSEPLNRLGEFFKSFLTSPKHHSTSRGRCCVWLLCSGAVTRFNFNFPSRVQQRQPVVLPSGELVVAHCELRLLCLPSFWYAASVGDLCMAG